MSLLNRKKHSTSTLLEQMMIISDCFLMLGMRDEAIAAYQSENWEFWYDFVRLIESEAFRTKNDSVLAHLGRAWLIKPYMRAA